MIPSAENDVIKSGLIPFLRYRDLRFRTVFPNGRVNNGMFVVAKVVVNRDGEIIVSRLGNAAE